jgi:OHCU decarboxylase
MTFEEFNAAEREICRNWLLRCCGAQEWADGMLARRPFRNWSQLEASADEVWCSLGEGEWLEAFAKHPKIGESSPGWDAVSRQWSSDEQRGMATADGDLAAGMQQLNRDYEAKFGWIFIVCATGKSAEEMRMMLEERLGNTAEQEIRIATSEQAKITKIRLRKLLSV